MKNVSHMMMSRVTSYYFGLHHVGNWVVAQGRRRGASSFGTSPCRSPAGVRGIMRRRMLTHRVPVGVEVDWEQWCCSGIWGKTS